MKSSINETESTLTRHINMTIANYILNDVVPSTEWYKQGNVVAPKKPRARIYNSEIEALEKIGYYPLQEMLKMVAGDTTMSIRNNRYIQLFWKLNNFTKRNKYSSETLKRGQEVPILIDEMKFLGQMAKHNGNWFLKRVDDESTGIST